MSLADLPQRFQGVVDDVLKPGFPDNFSASPVFNKFMGDYYVVPFTAAVLYVIVIFGVQRMMSSPTTAPLNLRGLSTLWNTLLCVFSTFGAIVTVPYLISWIWTDGFANTLCYKADTTFLRGPVGAVGMAFIWSKIPELFDTVLLVTQKKPLIFLHWYHHITVMIYSWAAGADLVGYAMYFITMNYAVHAVMYGYYAGMTASSWTRRLVAPLAQLITTMQLLQMVGGLVVVTSTYFLILRDPKKAAACHVTPSNMAWCAAMYFSYFLLFGKLFYDYYLSPEGARRRKLKLQEKAAAKASASSPKRHN